jgi:hypothetical protein
VFKNFSEWLKSLIVRPMSVTMDVVIATAFGVVAYLLLGFVKGVVPLGDALQPSLAGIFAAMVYMRARTNLLDPSPAFKV